MTESIEIVNNAGPYAQSPTNKHVPHGHLSPFVDNAEKREDQTIFSYRVHHPNHGCEVAESTGEYREYQTGC